ncbi:MAG TPA: hypothetical protein VFB42_14890 [Gaiellaceae bacterium]|nr:hypothetical protein [Gaiellaceae bacterium]
MTEKQKRDQPAKSERHEKTPRGLEVRIPSRGEFFGNLKKVIRPEKE